MLKTRMCQAKKITMNDDTQREPCLQRAAAGDWFIHLGILAPNALGLGVFFEAWMHLIAHKAPPLKRTWRGTGALPHSSWQSPALPSTDNIPPLTSRPGFQVLGIGDFDTLLYQPLLDQTALLSSCYRNRLSAPLLGIEIREHSTHPKGRLLCSSLLEVSLYNTALPHRHHEDLLYRSKQKPCPRQPSGEY